MRHSVCCLQHHFKISSKESCLLKMYKKERLLQNKKQQCVCGNNKNYAPRALEPGVLEVREDCSPNPVHEKRSFTSWKKKSIYIFSLGEGRGCWGRQWGKTKKWKPLKGTRVHPPQFLRDLLLQFLLQMLTLV